MPSATGNTTARFIKWSSTDVSVRYFDVYRRTDSVTASITTSDIVAKVSFGSNHFVDATGTNIPYWYWVKAISWAGHSSAFSDTITAVVSSLDLTVGGNLIVCGTTTCNGVVSINSDANISGNLTVDGSTILKGSLTVSGATTINNNLSVTGTATIDGATKINDTLDVSGAATFSDYISVASSIKTLFIELTASANPPTPVTGGTIRLFAKDTGGVTVPCVIDTAGTVTQLGSGGSLALDDLTDVDTAGVAEGNVIAYSSSGTWKARAQSGGGGYALFITEANSASIDTDGQDAHLNFDGDDFNVTVGSGESATVSLADGLVLGGGLTVNGGLAVSGNVTVSGDASINGNLVVSGTSTLIGAATLRGALTVSGVTTINNNLNVTGALTVDGATVLKGTLTVSGATTVNSTLNVTGATTIDGVAKINNTLQVTGATTIDGAVKVNNTLQVTGATTIGGTLTVSGTLSLNAAANISGALTVDGATVLKSTLVVSGVATINNNLAVTGTLTVDGKTTINDEVIVSGVTTLLGQVRVATTAGVTLAGVTLERAWTSNTTGHYGFHIHEKVSQATPNTTALYCTGLGGYVGLENTLFGATYNVCGLDFMPYEVGAVAGHTAYLTSYGIRTGGAAGFAGTFNALAICGLDVGMVSQGGADYGSNVNAATGYGILIENGAGLGGTKTIGTAYQLYINGIASVTTDANKWIIWANDGKSYFRQNVSGAAGDVMHFHQDHTAGATGCVKLTQDHQGYDFMHFVSPASAGTSYSINTTERNTFNCMIAIKVNGKIRWLKAYA